MHNLIDPTGMDADITGQPGLAHAQQLQKFLKPDLTGSNRGKLLAQGRLLLIVRDLHVIGLALVPPKADVPPLVDANTVWPFTIAGALFKTSARRDAEVVKSFRRRQHRPFTPRDTTHVCRESS
jgi:hypothetical protein